MKIFKKNNEEYRNIVRKALDEKKKKTKANDDDEVILSLTETEIDQLREFLNGDAEIEVVADHEGMLSEEEVKTLKDILPLLVDMVSPEEVEEEEDFEDDKEIAEEDEEIIEEDEDEEFFAEDKNTQFIDIRDSNAGGLNREIVKALFDKADIQLSYIDDVAEGVIRYEVVIKPKGENTFENVLKELNDIVTKAGGSMPEIEKAEDNASTEAPDVGTEGSKEVKEVVEEKIEQPEEKAADEKKVFVKKTLNKAADRKLVRPKRANPNASMFKPTVKALDRKEETKRTFNFHK